MANFCDNVEDKAMPLVCLSYTSLSLTESSMHLPYIGHKNRKGSSAMAAWRKSILYTKVPHIATRCRHCIVGVPGHVSILW